MNIHHNQHEGKNHEKDEQNKKNIAPLHIALKATGSTLRSAVCHACKWHHELLHH